MSSPPVDDQLQQLALAGIDYGMKLAADENGAFPPALLSVDAEGAVTVTQLVPLGQHIEDVFGYACESLRNIPDALCAAVVMDGYVHIAGSQEDAVIVRVGSRVGQSHEFGQRYKRSGWRKELKPVGNVGYSGERPPLFT